MFKSKFLKIRVMDERQYFSVVDESLYFLDSPLNPSSFLDESTEVLGSHVIPKRDEKNLYSSLIFCLASHSLVYERALALMSKLRDFPLEDLRDPNKVWDVASKGARFPENRFEEPLNYATSVGIEQLAYDFLANPSDTREKLVKNAKWIGLKTASFWYLCFGGQDLMTLDIHNLRQLAALDGVNVDPRYFNGKRRESGKSKGKLVADGPSPREYRRIEKEALKLLAGFPEFNGEGVRGDLATTVFWWAGVKGTRRSVRQLDLPGMSSTTFVSPY
jgi:thermostable 8-oxoguanine DNA glycosylase